MTSPQIMTKEEIHNFGIEVVFNYMKEEGYEIEGVDDTIGVNPQIIAKKNDKLVFVAVRTSCYPNKGKLENHIHHKMIKQAEQHNAIPYFASVGIINSDGKTEEEQSTPVKGAGFYISFDGLLIITTKDKVKIMKPHINKEKKL